MKIEIIAAIFYWFLKKQEIFFFFVRLTFQATFQATKSPKQNFQATIKFAIVSVR